jgi:3-hydroxyethyl bacteriochlorophyllide a dehydrogenase
MYSLPTERGQGDGVTTRAVVFEQPEALSLRELELAPPGPGEVLVNVEYSGISTGTEKLLWTGRMPPFPGMGYPLVPGYETVGRVVATGPGTSMPVGARVFVSGARCYGEIRGLFGGASSRLVVEESKTIQVDDTLDEEAILLALSATAHHALFRSRRRALPELIIGHGVLGRLLARLTIALGGLPPTVWEKSEHRQHGATEYPVTPPESDERRDYSRIIDASGDPSILDSSLQRLAKQGEIVLAGFYSEPLSFDFPPAFMREAQIRVAAEWQPEDLAGVSRLLEDGSFTLENLITHRAPASDAAAAYPIAFSDPECLKMVLDWREH